MVYVAIAIVAVLAVGSALVVGVLGATRRGQRADRPPRAGRRPSPARVPGTPPADLADEHDPHVQRTGEGEGRTLRRFADPPR